MSPLRLLHLEDSALDVELVAAVLAAEGMHPDILTVSSENEFLAGIETGPDAILADYFLPSYNGMLALEVARKRCPDTPFIFVSGTLGEETAVEAMRHGATDYVLKTRLDRLPLCVARAVDEATQKAQRKMAERELVESREMLALALEASRMGSWSWNLVTNELIWSERCRALFGVGPEEPVSMDIFYERIHPGDRDGVRARLDETMWQGKDYAAEHRVLHPGGGSHWLYAAGRATYDQATGKPVRMSGVVFDITARKRIEEDLREANRRKTEFLAMLSHELRNPLAAIRYALQEMREHGNSPDSAVWTRDVIDRQSKHLSKLVDELLDVTRISRGRVQLHPEVLDLAGVLDNAVAAVRSLVAERRHQMVTEYEHGSLPVDADPTRMEQVMVNLLANAAKYTEPGGTIWLHARREKAEVIVTVRDTGVGISKEELPRIFEVFTQGHRSIARSEGGIGLGLSIVRGLVAMHGGSIAASSGGAGQGSVFIVRLPLARTAPPLPTAAAPSKPPTAEPPPPVTKQRRILVVDDNLDSLRGLTRLLRIWGHDVREAPDGLIALEIAEEFHPDVALLDIGLPGMDGYTLADRLRNGVCRDSLLVAISGYGQEEDRRRSREAGCDLHCVKPVGAETIKRLVSLTHEGMSGMEATDKAVLRASYR